LYRWKLGEKRRDSASNQAAFSDKDKELHSFRRPGQVSNSSALLRRSNKKSYSADNFKVASLEKLESTDLRPHPKQPGGSSFRNCRHLLLLCFRFPEEPIVKEIEKIWVLISFFKAKGLLEVS
jgi:hypothetical protein